MPCNDGNACTVDETCSNGLCIGGTPVADDTPCDDGIFCNGTDTCDGSGVCVHAGDPCSGFICDEPSETCRDEIWYGLGGSEFGSWKDHIGREAGDTLPVGGGISDNFMDSVLPDIVMDDSGNPVVTWENGTDVEYDCTMGSEHVAVYVKRFDDSVPGGAWIEMGAGSATGGGIGQSCDFAPIIVKDSDGNLFAAHDQTNVKKFDGSNWIDMGGPDFVCYRRSLAVDNLGFPWLATCYYDQVRTARYDGNLWNEIELLTDSPQNGNCQLSMAMDHSGNPVLAWSVFSEVIHVTKYDGNTWVELGEGSLSEGDTRFNKISMNLDAAGNPIIAWTDNSSGNDEIYVKRYDGNDWVEVGTGSATGGGISANASASIEPSLALDSAGRPVVAWEDHSMGEPEIYVKGFDGTGWVEIGNGSASGGGISNSAAVSHTPSIAIGGGQICVAWSEWGMEPYAEQIVMRCASECVLNCTGRCCGDNGCGGTCPGDCPADYVCNHDTCGCEPTSCTTNADCMATQCCRNGVCVGMNCGELECGPDPVCGKECGPCPADRECVDGKCVIVELGQLGDPCPFDNVNEAAGLCEESLLCVGDPADGVGGRTCPGGSTAECIEYLDIVEEIELLEERNIDCVNGNCGISFCTYECDNEGRCPLGFLPQNVNDTCACIPEQG
jgi:hypothetical protein